MYKILLSVVTLVIVIAIIVQIAAAFNERQSSKNYPATGVTLYIDGYAVHAIVQGEGPDLVLIHGASGSTRDFTFDFVQRLSERYRVIIFDRPGLGHSQSISAQETSVFSTTASTPMEQASHLAKAAKELDVHRPIVLGHSFGGSLALSWALEHPNDIAGLVLVASVSNPWPGDLGWYYQVNGSLLGGAFFAPLLTAFAPQSAIDGTMDAIFEPQPAPEGYTQYVGAELVLRRNSLRANARQVSTLRPNIVELSQQYHMIDMPVEIIHGDADTIVPLEIHSAKLVDQIKGASLTVLPGIGHMPHHTNPTDVIAAIDRIAAKNLP